MSTRGPGKEKKVSSPGLSSFPNLVVKPNNRWEMIRAPRVDNKPKCDSHGNFLINATERGSGLILK
jgi:hypothetical protein